MGFCPIMNNECAHGACELWIEEKKTDFRCTLSLELHDECPLENTVETPSCMQGWCGGCKHYKEFTIKPIRAHCGILDRGRYGVL